VPASLSGFSEVPASLSGFSRSPLDMNPVPLLRAIAP